MKNNKNDNIFGKADLKNTANVIADAVTTDTNKETVFNEFKINTGIEKSRKIQLSLSISSEKITKLKNVARKHNVSVSNLIEQFIDQLK